MVQLGGWGRLLTWIIGRKGGNSSNHIFSHPEPFLPVSCYLHQWLKHTDRFSSANTPKLSSQRPMGYRVGNQFRDAPERLGWGAGVASKVGWGFGVHSTVIVPSLGSLDALGLKLNQHSEWWQGNKAKTLGKPESLFSLQWSCVSQKEVHSQNHCLLTSCFQLFCLA